MTLALEWLLLLIVIIFVVVAFFFWRPWWARPPSKWWWNQSPSEWFPGPFWIVFGILVVAVYVFLGPPSGCQYDLLDRT